MSYANLKRFEFWILLICGLAWLDAGAGEGLLALLLAAIPGGAMLSCEAFGPAALLDDYPGLFWYGIHSAEMLFAFMGTGCQSARCIATPDLDVVIGEWEDGRIGLLILGLIVFRIVWGFIGSTTARFVAFFPTPGRLAA